MCGEEPSEYCADCEVHLCGAKGSNCTKELHSAKHMKNHRIIPYEENDASVKKQGQTKRVAVKLQRSVVKPQVRNKKSEEEENRNKRQEKKRARASARAIARQRGQVEAASRWEFCQENLAKNTAHQAEA